MIIPLASLAHGVNCGQCWQGPGEPCGQGYDHLARYLRAGRKGLLSSSQLQLAVGQAVTLDGVEVVRHADKPCEEGGTVCLEAGQGRP